MEILRESWDIQSQTELEHNGEDAKASLNFARFGGESARERYLRYSSAIARHPFRHLFPDAVRIHKPAADEVESYQRIFDRPVPFAVDSKAPEQFPVAIKEFLELID